MPRDFSYFSRALGELSNTGYLNEVAQTQQGWIGRTVGRVPVLDVISNTAAAQAPCDDFMLGARSVDNYHPFLHIGNGKLSRSIRDVVGDIDIYDPFIHVHLRKMPKNYRELKTSVDVPNPSGRDPQTVNIVYSVCREFEFHGSMWNSKQAKKE